VSERLLFKEQLFSYIMARTSYISARWWWCLLCSVFIWVQVISLPCLVRVIVV